MPRAFGEDRDTIARSRVTLQVRSAIQEAVFMDDGGAPGDSWAARTRGGAGGDPDKLGGLDGIAPKTGLADYSWGELKQVARAIAAAGCHAEAITIARIYNLVGKDGRLWGDEEHRKPVVLQDGTRASVRVLGFRHDGLAGGAGSAGISFEFADVPAVRRMNVELINRGGWQGSEMRDWLNTVFWGMLPPELGSNIVEVAKRTSYRDWYAPHEEAFHVAGTLDRLWLLSMPEVYGNLSPYRRSLPEYMARYAAVYDAEGAQYQLYADNDVSVANYGFCWKIGADSWWWLRSPDADDSNSFRSVGNVGDWNWNHDASTGWGVSPGFCF